MGGEAVQVGWALFFSLFVLPKKNLNKRKKKKSRGKKRFFPGSRTRFGTEYHRQNRQNFADQGPPFSFPALSPFFPTFTSIKNVMYICMYVCMYTRNGYPMPIMLHQEEKGGKKKKGPKPTLGGGGATLEYIQTYTHTHTHIHTYIHTYIHTHTHIHTYIQEGKIFFSSSI